MATILTKKKDTSGAPSAGDLTNSSGGAELAVNTADKRLYTKDSGGNVVEVGINPTSITTGTLNTSGAVVFNDAGADVDFRVEGDTDANLLFVDASTDRVGIGTSSPGAPLDVRGSARFLANDNASSRSITLGPSDFVSSAKYLAISWSHTNSAGEYYTQGAYPHIFYTNNTERMRIDSSGNLLVGTTSENPANDRDDGVALLPNGIRTRCGSAVSYFALNATSGTNIGFYTDNGSTAVAAGSITSNGATTAYGLGSDYRMKTNVEPMTGALAKVLQLNPVTFIWKEEFAGTNPNGQGFIAHELQEICPDAVVGEKDATEMRQVLVSPAVPATYDDEGNELTPAVEAVYEEREFPKYQTVDTSFLVATLTAAIQELSAKNDALEARIAALENA